MTFEPPPPRVLLFDLSEVLISGLRGVEQVLATRIDEPEGEILQKLGGELLRRLCRGSISEDEYWTAVRDGNRWEIAVDDLRGMIRRNFHHCVPGMPELVRELHERVDLVLVSDHAREWIEYIEDTHPFLGLFEVRVYSFETGWLKDEAAAFGEVLVRIGRDASECLFVDDDSRNVQQAERVGIRSIRFEGRDALVRCLGDLGFRV
jgi:HAD superfamily hydrolase (TIGR01509 family)